jgi:hypothetical protein
MQLEVILEFDSNSPVTSNSDGGLVAPRLTVD